jgi:hypothetical protein
MRAVLDQELVRFGDHAIDASMVLLTFDEPAGIALVPALSGRDWDVVLSGGGIRKTDPLVPLFEQVVSLVSLSGEFLLGGAVSQRTGRRQGNSTGAPAPAERPRHPATPRPLHPLMPQLQIKTFRAQTMIMASSGRYPTVSGRDHGTAWCEGARLKFLALPYTRVRSTSTRLQWRRYGRPLGRNTGPRVRELLREREGPGRLPRRGCLDPLRGA